MIAYGHSGSVLRWCEERGAQQQASPSGHRHEVVALGDPVFRRGGEGTDSTLLALRGGDGTLPRLPGTRTEVASICRTLTGHEPGADTCGGGTRVAVLLGECATEARLRELAPQGRYLHLATHHLVDEDGEASYCRLALTMPEHPVPGDDGYLSLR